MTTPQTRINAFRAGVVTKILAIMPELASVDTQLGRFDLDELEKTIVKTPAVRVAVLNSPVSFDGGGTASAELECAAFVITDGKDRDERAWAIAEAIALQLKPGQLWGVFNMGAPERQKITPVVSGNLKNRNVCITAVEWRQTLHKLGDGIWDDQGKLMDGLYINGEEIPPPDEDEEESA